MLDLPNKNTRCPIKLERTSHTLLSSGDFPGGTLVKSLPSLQGTRVPSLVQELSSRKPHGMAKTKKRKTVDKTLFLVTEQVGEGPGGAGREHPALPHVTSKQNEAT